MRAVLARPAPLGTRRVPSSNFRRRPRPLPTVRPCRCAPKFNPQNVHDSSITPALELDALSCVEAQMEALRSPHSPRTNHGIEVMYAFCEGSGSMERSRYFGYSKDLYHFDHFLGGFQVHTLLLALLLMALADSSPFSPPQERVPRTPRLRRVPPRRRRWKERAGGGDSGRGRHRLAGSLVVRGDVHFLPRGERLRQKKGLLDDFKDN